MSAMLQAKANNEEATLTTKRHIIEVQSLHSMQTYAAGYLFENNNSFSFLALSLARYMLRRFFLHVLLNTSPTASNFYDINLNQKFPQRFSHGLVKWEFSFDKLQLYTRYPNKKIDVITINQSSKKAVRETIIGYIFVADSMGLSSFKFPYSGSERRICFETECIMAFQLSRSFKVVNFGTSCKHA